MNIKKLISSTILLLTYIEIILCWNCFTNFDHSPIGLLFIKLPIFLIFLLILIILDWTVHRKILGVPIIIPEAMLLFIFFAIFSVKTATISDALIGRTIPENPNRPAQKFRITQRGKMFLKLLQSKFIDNQQ